MSGSVYQTHGKFKWNEKGNTITLTPAHNTQGTQYFVGENLLTQLDKQGNKVTGDNASRYVLSKSNYEILEKYWKLDSHPSNTLPAREVLEKFQYLLKQSLEMRLRSDVP